MAAIILHVYRRNNKRVSFQIIGKEKKAPTVMLIKLVKIGEKGRTSTPASDTPPPMIAASIARVIVPLILSRPGYFLFNMERRTIACPVNEIDAAKGMPASPIKSERNQARKIKTNTWIIAAINGIRVFCLA